jgi:hypothetical protein
VVLRRQPPPERIGGLRGDGLVSMRDQAWAWGATANLDPQPKYPNQLIHDPLATCAYPSLLVLLTRSVCILPSLPFSTQVRRANLCEAAGGSGQRPFIRDLRGVLLFSSHGGCPMLGLPSLVDVKFPLSAFSRPHSGPLSLGCYLLLGKARAGEAQGEPHRLGGKPHSFCRGAHNAN